MKKVTVDLETAKLIRRAFLPVNPDKMRTAAPEVVDAARKFIDAVEAAEKREEKPSPRRSLGGYRTMAAGG